MRLRLVSAAAAVLAAASTLGASAAVPGVPSLYVDYSPNCTFTLEVDPGTAIAATTAPGPTLPPGTYDLTTTMSNTTTYQCGKPLLAFSGPGASYQVLFPGQEIHDEHLVTLQPSSTYSVDDENAPAATRKFFTTAAIGSSVSLLPVSTSKNTGSNVQPDIVGSGLAVYRGKLAATVSATGAVTLVLHGKHVKSLKTGRYDIVVDDADARAGFFVQRRGHTAIAVTGLAFKGKHVRRVTFTKGTWTFFSQVGKPTSFTVAA